MATVKAVPPKPARPDIQITLNDREALVLRRILDFVAGPATGPRGVVDEIMTELFREGITEDRARDEVVVSKDPGAVLRLDRWADEIPF